MTPEPTPVTPEAADAAATEAVQPEAEPAPEASTTADEASREAPAPEAEPAPAAKPTSRGKAASKAEKDEEA